MTRAERPDCSLGGLDMVRARPARARVALVGLLGALAVLGMSPAARAQDTQGNTFNLQLFRPAVDSKGYFTVNASQILRHLDFSIGLIGTYAHNVLELHNPNVMGISGSMTNPVTGQSAFRVSDFVTAQVQAAIGLFKWAELGVS